MEELLPYNLSVVGILSLPFQNFDGRPFDDGDFSMPLQHLYYGSDGLLSRLVFIAYKMKRLRQSVVLRSAYLSSECSKLSGIPFCKLRDPSAVRE